MKKVIFLFGMALFMSISFQLSAQDKKDKGGNANGNQEVILQTSAQCGMCKDRIEGAFASVKGVKEAVLNLDDKKLTVVYNSAQVDVEAIKTVVIEVGYDADELPADEAAYEKLPKCCKKGGHD